jgi:hypothetical protein
MMMARQGAVDLTEQCWYENLCPIIDGTIRQTLLGETPDTPTTMTEEEQLKKLNDHFRLQEHETIYVEDEFVQGLSHYLRREIQIISAIHGHVTTFEPLIQDSNKKPLIVVYKGDHYMVCI